MVRLGVFVLLLCVFSHAERVNYSGYQVWHVKARDDVRLNNVFESLQVDIWRRPLPTSPVYHVMIPGRLVEHVTQLLRHINVTYDVWIDDVQRLISDDTMKGRLRHRRNPRVFRFNEYHKYDEILGWMEKFARVNSDLVSLFQVGSTYEGRRIMAMKIGVPGGNKQVIWQDSLIHAREWISGATLLWLSHKLVRDYRQHEADVTSLLRRFDWIILPVWNVDGYIYSWTKDRLWRKSRTNVGPFGCKGVDLNRNFYTPNRGAGISSDYTCSGVYQGNSPFSEPESSSVSRYLSTLNLAAFISIHSYAQYWLYPYGYKSTSSEDNEDLKRVALEAVAAIKRTHGKEYKQGRVIDLAYEVAGGSVDWAHQSLCVKYSYGVELRDRGKHGFILPRRYIVPTAEEYFEAVKVVARHIARNETTRSTECMTSQ
ncbi:carboxypeptidase B-like [Ciona intestinalis]